MGDIDRWSAAVPTRRGSGRGGGRVTSGANLEDVVLTWEDVVPESTRRALGKQGLQDVMFSQGVFSRSMDAVWVVPSVRGVPSGVVRVYRNGDAWRWSKFAWGVPSGRCAVTCPSVPFGEARGAGSDSSAGGSGQRLWGDLVLPDLVPDEVESLLRDTVSVPVDGRLGATVSRRYERRRTGDEIVVWGQGQGAAVLVVIRREVGVGMSGGDVAAEERALAGARWSGEAWVWTPPIRGVTELGAGGRSLR